MKTENNEKQKAMKTTILILVFIIFFSTISSAQREENNYQAQTIFSDGTRITGWFVDFSNSYSEINDKYSYLPGFSAGVVMNRNFRIGITGKSLSCYETYLKYDNLFDETVYLEGGYGGLYLEASPIDEKVIHISFPVIIGVGGACYLTKQKYADYDDDWDWDWDFDLKTKRAILISFPRN